MPAVECAVVIELHLHIEEVVACRGAVQAQGVVLLIIPVEGVNRLVQTGRLALILVGHETFQCGGHVIAPRLERCQPFQAQAFCNKSEVYIQRRYGIHSGTCLQIVSAAIHIAVPRFQGLYRVVYHLPGPDVVHKDVAFGVGPVFTYFESGYGKRAGRCGPGRYRVAPDGRFHPVRPVYFFDKTGEVKRGFYPFAE